MRPLWRPKKDDDSDDRLLYSVAVQQKQKQKTPICMRAWV